MHKRLSSILRLVAAAALAFGFSQAYAFHSGGVADCAGCHSMHSPKVGGTFLLIGSDQSSTCLSCHAAGSGLSSYHVATNPLPATGIPSQRSPGGDFSWTGISFFYTGREGAVREGGETHGHNIVAADFAAQGFSADPVNTVAPGGTFASSQLGCQSCHDPHGQVRRIGGDVTFTWGRTGAPIIASGSYSNSAVPSATQAVGHYRLLRGGNDSTQGVNFAGYVYAIAPSTYNQTEATNQVRVAYGNDAGTNTIGQWCATCHPAMHSSGNYVHPVDEGLGSTIAQNYGKYVSSGIMTGTAASSYSSLNPFAEATSSFTVLKSHARNNGSQLGGPSSSDTVMCLSCHRAHASAFPEALRWYSENEFITRADTSTGLASYPGSDVPGMSSGNTNVGRTAAFWQAGYYDRPASVFGAGGFQRQLCNKCHAKD
jgi:predicted CXXCH cytochrome family protein